jgi:hypothetical protein
MKYYLRMIPSFSQNMNSWLNAAKPSHAAAKHSYRAVLGASTEELTIHIAICTDTQVIEAHAPEMKRK